MLSTSDFVFIHFIVFILLWICYPLLKLFTFQEEIEGYSKHDESATPGGPIVPPHVEVK